MIVNVSFKDKKVIIFGAGNQGKRKAKQFEAEGALVTLVDRYNPQDMDDYDLVFAATSDREVNQQIILDAKAKNKQCGSVHYDENATIHMNLQKDLDGFTYSLFAPGTSVYALRKFQAEIEKLYEESFKQELEDTKYIRLRMIEEGIENRIEILEMLAHFSSETIHHIRKAYETGKTTVYCLHGSSRGNALDYFHEFYAYEKENPNVPSIVQMIDLFHTLKIKAKYRIVMLQKGLAYQRMKSLLKNEESEDRILNESCIQSLFSKQANLLYIVHGQVDYTKLSGENWKIMELGEEIPEIDQPCRIVPLFLVRAKHMKKDVFENLYPQIQSMYPNTYLEKRCLLEYPEIIDYIKGES